MQLDLSQPIATGPMLDAAASHSSEYAESLQQVATYAARVPERSETAVAQVQHHVANAPLSALKHLLWWLYDARRQGTLNEAYYEKTRVLIGRWLQQACEYSESEEVASADIAEPTIELDEQSNTVNLNEHETAGLPNNYSLNPRQKNSPTSTLTCLLHWLHDARCYAMLDDACYEASRNAAIAQWLQEIPERIDALHAQSDEIEDLTAELDAQHNTLDLHEHETPTVPKQSDKTSLSAYASISQSNIAPAIDPFQPGHLIRDRYVIEDVIGQGGFAILYRARDLQRHATDGCDLHVALKVLRPALRERPQAIARLQREFRQTHLLSHPAIVRLFDLDAHNGVWFIVMELLEGETLAAKLRRDKYTVPVTETLALLSACADALSFAHRHHITHGDFKPANLFLLRDHSVRIVDFGNAPELHESTSMSAFDQLDRVATPAYASPQVLSRESAMPCDDLFSFACVAFEMLTGVHPFARQSSLQAQLHGDTVAEPAALSPHQMTVLKQGLAWRREDRADSIGNFFHSLATPVPAEIELQDKANDMQTDLALADSPAVTSDAALISLAAHVVMQELSDSHTVAPADIASNPVASLFRRAREWRFPTPLRAVIPPMPVLGSSHSQVFGWFMVVVLMYVGFLFGRSTQVERPSSPPSQLSRERVADQDMPATLLSASTASATDVAFAVAKNSAAQLTKPIKTIAATPPAPAVSFDRSVITVTERAVAAAIAIKRTNGDAGRLRVTWRLKAGSAVPGQDFSGPVTGVAEFADRQQIRTLFVPLLNNPERSGNRTFAIELIKTSKKYAAISPIPTVEVTILDAG